MFSAQAGQIANALKAAGLAPDAANKIAAILGNGVQNLVRTNPEQVDLTPQSLKYVTPDVRKYELQGLDFRQADPDYRPYQLETSENRRPVTQASSVRDEPPPQKTTATYRVQGGQFTDARGSGESVQVNLRFSGTGKHPIMDSQSNTVVGKSFRCEADQGLPFFIEETPQEVVWKLQLSEFLQGVLLGTVVDVVTDVSLQDGNLVFSRQRVRVLSAEVIDPAVIETTSCSS